jgi:signal transduction histidine kinase
MFKKDFSVLVEKTLAEIEALNYVEQFLDLFPGFFSKHLPVSSVSVFILNNEETEFIPYFEKRNARIKLKPIIRDSHLIIYLKNSRKPIVIKDESPSRIKFLKKTNPDFFEKLRIDIVIPLFSIKKLYGFVVIEAAHKTYRELESLSHFFKIFSNILIPLITSERSQIENSRNYYKIYRMDRLAMVGELAASAAHEIKNPLAGISTFLKYFSELEDFKKADISEELQVMKDSVQRINEIVKSLLSFSRFKKKEIRKINLSQVIESSMNSIALKVPSNITVVNEMDEDFIIETDSQQLQQVLVNILFNAIEAIDKKEGKIFIRTYISGRHQLPSRELFNISVKDNGPGIDESFKEKLFQPFQTTREEGTGLGLYTCYGLMKSLGGNIKINSTKDKGTDVILSLPYSFDDEYEEE